MSPKLQQVRDRVRRAVSREPEAPEEEAEESAPPDEPPAREALLRSLERGRALDHALISQVRALLADGENDSARALALGLREHPETEALGRLAGGIVAHREGYAELAWDLLRPVPREAWTRFAVSEYVRSGLAVAPAEVLAELRSLVADDPPEVRSKSWHDMLAPVFGYGESELARQIYERFDRHAREDENPWDEADRKRDWMRPWIAADPDSPTAPATGRRTFAVIDYGHPGADRASANLGDHVQSIASLGHLVRHQGVRLHGRDELAGLLERLRERTRPERRLDDVEAELDVITVHRDASMYEAVPEDTWTLCFGWYMHALFGIRHGFPLHRNLRPIFVSFHCNKRGLLTPEAIEYLRRYGPVGCRDWNTVFLLLSLDVPAFFSGCLTTTIDTVFPDRRAAAARCSPGLRGRRARARGRGRLPPQRPGSARAPVRGQRRARARAAGDLPRRASGRGHLAPALLPAGPLDRRRRRVPALQPVGHPLRRAHRPRRRGLRRDARGHRRQARAGLPRDPHRPPGGRGLRAVARADGRPGRRGGAAPPRGRAAGTGGARTARGRPGEDRHARHDRG